MVYSKTGARANNPYGKQFIASLPVMSVFINGHIKKTGRNFCKIFPKIFKKWSSEKLSLTKWVKDGLAGTPQSVPIPKQRLANNRTGRLVADAQSGIAAAAE